MTWGAEIDLWMKQEVERLKTSHVILPPPVSALPVSLLTERWQEKEEVRETLSASLCSFSWKSTILQHKTLKSQQVTWHHRLPAVSWRRAQTKMEAVGCSSSLFGSEWVQTSLHCIISITSRMLACIQISGQRRWLPYAKVEDVLRTFPSGKVLIPKCRNTLSQ